MMDRVNPAMLQLGVEAYLEFKDAAPDLLVRKIFIAMTSAIAGREPRETTEPPTPQIVEAARLEMTLWRD